MPSKTTIDEDKSGVRVPAEVFHPGEFIRDELDARGWTQSDLSKIMDRPLSAINLIITGKKGITVETAIGLAGAFGTSPEFWLNLENAYKLSKASTHDEATRKRARLFEMAPVKELERRGWIKPTKTVAELEERLRAFYDTPNLESLPSLKMAARTSVQNGTELNAEQLAWCIQALRIAKDVPAEKYSPSKLEAGLPKLRQLAAHPEEIRKVPRVLSGMGIRFVVVEHLPKTKIDGAALWLGDDWDKPVIVLSMRYDRIDCFWHTLCHEISHIRHKDSYVVDVDIACEVQISTTQLSEIETRANREAAETLIPADRLRSFILRVRPYFKKERINQFANLLQIHPGIVTGQLQHAGEIEWAANREMLVKVREILIAEAMTDGWGTITAPTD